MADAQVLRELADEVEGLDGPDTLVDLKIYDALHDEESEVPVAWVTASIDAAAKLMPAGWSGKVEFSAQRVVAHAWHVEHRGIRVEARTEALARTACALRALAADLEGKTDATTV